MKAAANNVAPGHGGADGLLSRAKGAQEVLRFMRKARIGGELDGLEQRLSQLLTELERAQPPDAQAALEGIEDSVLEIDAGLIESILMAGLASASDGQRRAYVRLLATRPITTHKRMERFLRLCRRLGERREASAKPAELVEGLPRAASGEAEALEKIAAQREQLRRCQLEGFFRDNVYVKLRTERLKLAPLVTTPRVLAGLLRFEVELEARLTGWTRELTEHKAAHPDALERSPSDYIASAVRQQEQKLRKALGELGGGAGDGAATEESGDRESGSRPSTRPKARKSNPPPKRARDLKELEQQLRDQERDDEANAPAGPPGPSAVERVREAALAHSGRAMALSVLVLALSVGAVALYLYDPVEQAEWGTREAREISTTLLGGQRYGTHFKGELDPERWKALSKEGRRAEADEIRTALKQRGVFSADLHLKGAEEPVLVIKFASVASIAD